MSYYYVEKTAYAVAMALGHMVRAYTREAFPEELSDDDVILRPEDREAFDAGLAVRISRASAEGSDRYQVVEHPMTPAPDGSEEEEEETDDADGGED